MARINIDIGTLGNPATGDTLRTAMTKINENFIDLYTSSTADGQLTTSVTNGDISIQPNGTGSIEIDTLSVQNSTITSITTNSDITLTPNGTGNVVLGNFTFNADQTVGAGQDNFVFTYDHSTGTIGLEASAAGDVTASSTTTFTNKTFDANGTGNSISNIDIADFTSGVFLDEDNMASNSATAIASQQSIKAYVDAEDANIASDTLTFTNKTFDVEGTGNSISNIDVADFKAAAIVTAAEGIGSNNNDTTIPTSAAVKAYADSVGGGGNGITFTGDDSAGINIADGGQLYIQGGTGITTSANSDGTITITASGGSGLQSRTTKAGSAAIQDGSTSDIDITGFIGYALYKIQTSHAARVIVYTSDQARDADASRAEGVDPTADAGVIAEVITTGAETVLISPGTIGFNDDSTVTTNIPIKVTNKIGDSASTSITVTLHLVQLES